MAYLARQIKMGIELPVSANYEKNLPTTNHLLKGEREKKK